MSSLTRREREDSFTVSDLHDHRQHERPPARAPPEEASQFHAQLLLDDALVRTFLEARLVQHVAQQPRAVGEQLGLPPEMVYRHPFPGPGLAIRCPGEITREKLDILRLADDIYIDEIRKAGLYDTIWQAFAVILPVKTVGVMGDGRTYDSVVGLRAVETTDFMTADFCRLPWDVLARVSSRIVNEVRGVSRVVYDVTTKPPATIEWE